MTTLVSVSDFYVLCSTGSLTICSFESLRYYAENERGERLSKEDHHDITRASQLKDILHYITLKSKNKKETTAQRISLPSKKKCLPKSQRSIISTDNFCAALHFSSSTTPPKLSSMPTKHFTPRRSRTCFSCRANAGYTGACA